MFGKIENGRLKIAGQKIQIENGWITNPTEEDLKANGYKTVEYTERPEYDREEEKLVETYDEKKTKITVSYEIAELNDYENNNIIQQEIVAEENKITARNIRNAIKGDEFALNKIDEIEDNIAELRAKIREIETNEE